MVRKIKRILMRVVLEAKWNILIWSLKLYLSTTVHKLMTNSLMPMVVACKLNHHFDDKAQKRRNARHVHRILSASTSSA